MLYNLAILLLTYRCVDQRSLRLACPNAQTRSSGPSLLAYKIFMGVDKFSGQILKLYPTGYVVMDVFPISTRISSAGSYYLSQCMRFPTMWYEYLYKI